MSEHPPTSPEHTPPPVPPEDGVDPSLDIQSQDLSPEVRSYVDTLRQQVSDLFRKYGITTTGFRDAAAQLTARQDVSIKDLEHFRDINQALINIHETGALPPEVRESCPVTATVLPLEDSAASFEAGREITLNLREVLDSSLAFLESKAPPTWSQSLREAFPHGITLTPDQRKTIERAIEHGFTHALLMPGGDTQGITTVETQKPDPNDPTKQITERTLISPDTLRATTNHLLNTCSNADGSHPVPGLPSGDADGQYEAPYVGYALLEAPTLRPGAPSRTRPYLLLYRPDGVLPATKGKAYLQSFEILFATARDWSIPTLTGFTNHEDLLIQRKEVETRAPLTPEERTQQHGDPRVHGFDAYDDDASKSRWAWNLDSRVPECCPHGSWRPSDRRSMLTNGTATVRLLALGARPAVVVEL